MCLWEILYNAGKTESEKQKDILENHKKTSSDPSARAGMCSMDCYHCYCLLKSSIGRQSEIVVRSLHFLCPASHCYAGKDSATKCRLCGAFPPFFCMHQLFFSRGYLGNKVFCATSLYELFMSAGEQHKSWRDKESCYVFLTQGWRKIFLGDKCPFSFFYRRFCAWFQGKQMARGN